MSKTKKRKKRNVPQGAQGLGGYSRIKKSAARHALKGVETMGRVGIVLTLDAMGVRKATAKRRKVSISKQQKGVGKKREGP